MRRRVRISWFRRQSSPNPTGCPGRCVSPRLHAPARISGLSAPGPARGSKHLQGSRRVGKGTSLIYCDRTDIGRRRSNNQDSKAVLPPSNPQQYRTRGWMFLVADGMGAHAAGEEASRIAAERVPLVYEKLAQRSPPLALRRSLEQINGEINAKGEGAAAFKGMGTTCTTLVLLPRGALVGHIGDSRAYRIRGRRIEQLSRDHSLVWEIEASAGFSREQATGNVPKNIITRSMGPHPHVEVDLEGPFPVEEDDIFILCSDGLSGQVTDEEIGLLACELEPREAAAALVGLALVRGAPDNITVIVARAGREEISKVSSKDEPWPLSDAPVAARKAGEIPWRWLAIAATSLFVALLVSPWSDLMKADGLLEKVLGPANRPLVQAISYVASAAAVFATLAAALTALLAFLVPPSTGTRVLVPGKQLGKGPYRSYDCTATEQLFEGILGSIEAAAGDLSTAERDRMVTAIARARKNGSERSYHEAVVAAAEAIAIFTRAVEDSRNDETARSHPRHG
jgi:serine/threonine protein phosphatase PrpC